jgi:pre-mRNA-splicing factor CWC22
MTATTTFLAQLVNQQVAHEVLALQMLVLLLERPTDDSVEIAVSFMREVGAFLTEHSARANNGIFDRFRTILNESNIDKRVQYMVEVLFQVRKDKYKDNPIIPEGLDLVEEEDLITHRISLDDEVKVEEMLSTSFLLPSRLVPVLTLSYYRRLQVRPGIPGERGCLRRDQTRDFGRLGR